MSIQQCFIIPSPNVLQQYKDRVASEIPLAPSAKAFENEIDQWDWTILIGADLHFEAIRRRYLSFFIQAYSRLQLIEEPGDLDGDAVHKKESLITLVSFGMHYVREIGNSDLAEQVIRVNKASLLFLRSSIEPFGFLYRRMESVGPVSHRNPLQIGPFCGQETLLPYPMPRPPPLCCEDPANWKISEFPRGHCVSWAQSFTVVSGMIDDGEHMVELGKGVVEIRSLMTRIGELDWKGVGERVTEYVYQFFFPIRRMLGRPSELCVGFAPAAFYADRGTLPGSSPLSKPSSQLVADFIDSGFDSSAVWDTSEIATCLPTRWEIGEESPHYVPINYIGFRSGDRIVVESLLRNRGEMNILYPPFGSFDSPYQRAAVNKKDPTGLIAILEKAKQNPALRDEIAHFGSMQENPSFLSRWMKSFAPARDWPKFPQNHLVWAIERGSLELAEYLVSEERAKAEALCGPEQDKTMTAAAAASFLVQRKSSFGGPSETPVELAAKQGRSDLVQFLCLHGAKPPDIRVRLVENEHLVQQLAKKAREWEATKSALRHQANLLGAQVDISEKQLDELTAVTIAFRSFSNEQEIIVDRSLELADQIGQSLNSSLERIKRISAGIPLETTVVSRWQSGSFAHIPFEKEVPREIRR